MSLDTIRAPIAQELIAVDQTIAKHLGADIALIKELGEYIFGAGGKRLRPMLVLLVVKLFDYQGNNHILLAAIVELIHTATLLHDDVVDASTKRRGRETANQIWGNEASVLVGDYLYSRSFQMMIEIGELPVLTILANASNQIAEGEVMQLVNIGQLTLTESAYYDVIKRKTATLFQAAAQLGAVLCHRSSEETAALAVYGENLGIAFQLVDDALDYGYSSADIGKNLGDDLNEGKLTLPLIYALQQTNEQAAAQIIAAITNRSAEKLQEIIAILQSVKAFDYTIKQAHSFVDKAIQALMIFPASTARQQLITLAEFAVKRLI